MQQQQKDDQRLIGLLVFCLCFKAWWSSLVNSVLLPVSSDFDLNFKIKLCTSVMTSMAAFFTFSTFYWIFM
jgi:hypothetical protein